MTLNLSLLKVNNKTMHGNVDQYVECIDLTSNIDLEQIINYLILLISDSGGYDPETLQSEAESLELKPDANTTATEVLHWTRNATLLLIEEYKRNIELVKGGRLRKKAMWVKISKVMADNGHCISASQCERRFKTLMRGYKNVADHNRKSGPNYKTHPYSKELDF